MFPVLALIVVVLCLPVMGFTYLWDDYDFLTNALTYRLDDLLPDPADPFYRPISRGVYFPLLELAGAHGPLLGHILNLSFLVGVVLLLTTFTTRIAGERAGLLAGLLYAGIGALPLLVGWVSCSQDLLAMLFVLAALNSRLSGRYWTAAAATAGGLLCKETTLAVIPVLALFDRILGQRPPRVGRNVAAYAGIVAAWVVVHPAVKTLLARGFHAGATGYVGFEHAERWPVFFGRYLLTLLNLPAYKSLPSWPPIGTLLLLATLALAAISLWLLAWSRSADADGRVPCPQPRALILGGLLAIGPLILTSTAIRAWAPYYAGFPGLGLSIIAGTVLAAASLRKQAVAVFVYFALGIWARGTTHDPGTPTEPNLRFCSQTLRQVESGFRRLYGSFAPGTQLLLSTQARGPGGVYTHMYLFQALRVWYHDRSLRTVRPEARRATGAPEVLAVITPDRDVIDINLVTLATRTASGKDPDYNYCENAVRAYAMGLAGSGDTDDAVRTLLGMPETNLGLASVHLRMAASFLLAEGRESEADSVLRSAPALPRAIAIADLRAVLAEQPPGRVFDGYALRAFEISADDADAARELMRWFAGMKYVAPATRFAERLAQMRPGDLEASETIAKMTALREEIRKRPPGLDAIE